MTAVIFTSQRTKFNEGYHEYNEELEKLAMQLPGFIQQDSSRNENGYGISISYWENEAAALEFKKIPIHIEAQTKGREAFYEWYDVKICEVGRHYSFKK